MTASDQRINESIAKWFGARFFTEDGGAFWHFVYGGEDMRPPTESCETCCRLFRKMDLFEVELAVQKIQESDGPDKSSGPLTVAAFALSAFPQVMAKAIYDVAVPGHLK